MWSCLRAASAAVGFAVSLYIAVAIRQIPGHREEIVFVGNKVKCPATPSKLLRATVTLHPSTQQSVALACGDSAHVVPSTFGSGPDVCDMSVASLAECAARTKTSQKVRSLASLIPNAQKDWVRYDGRAYTLTIPESKFPLQERKFKVGCENPEPDNGCLVAIVVQARPTEVKTDELMCSYGQSVTVSADITKKSPSFRLICGPNYFIHPRDYSSQYCDGATVAHCTPRSYTSLFPGYQPSWWKAQNGKFVFRVPPDMFPGEDRTFVLGCSPDKELTGSSTVCNVSITVRSHAPGLVLRTAAAVVIFANFVNVL